MSKAWAASEAKTGDLPSIVIEGLLNWPFLAFLLALALLWFMRNDLVNLMKNKNITVSIAGNQVMIVDAVETINRETETEFVALQERVLGLEAKFDQLALATDDPELAGKLSAAASEKGDEEIWERLNSELQDGKYTWRTVDRLALVAGVAPEKVHTILARHDDVRMGRSKSGRKIARHMTREP